MAEVLDAVAGVLSLAALILLAVAVVSARRRDKAQLALAETLLALLDRLRIEVTTGAATGLRIEGAADALAADVADARKRANVIAGRPGHEAGAVADAAAGNPEPPA